VFEHFYDIIFNNEVIPCREILEIISAEKVPYDFKVLPQAQSRSHYSQNLFWIVVLKLWEYFTSACYSWRTSHPIHPSASTSYRDIRAWYPNWILFRARHKRRGMHQMLPMMMRIFGIHWTKPAYPLITIRTAQMHSNISTFGMISGISRAAYLVDL